MQAVLEALASGVRREILALVWDRELPAGDIAAEFQLSAPTISQHLTVLREAGLVTMTVDRNFRRYRARREVLRGLQAALFGDSPRWEVADNIPEEQLASRSTARVVIARVEIARPVEEVFDAFMDADAYSRWMGVPVTLESGRFSCTLEWGTRIRGAYDYVLPPSLIALRWDFDDDNIPVPGSEMIGYMRFEHAGAGCRIEVHQLVDTPEHADFMQVAWSMVLGRAKLGIEAMEAAPRAPRRKRA